MIEFEVTIPGYPHPLERARSKDGQGKHYDTAANIAAKDKIQLLTRWSRPLLTSPLRVDLWFLYQRPKPTADVDNLAKLVLDSYNQYVWKDDSQILDLVIHKRGGKPADCTIIHVEEIEA